MHRLLIPDLPFPPHPGLTLSPSSRTCPFPLIPDLPFPPHPGLDPGSPCTKVRALDPQNTDTTSKVTEVVQRAYRGPSL